MRTTAEISTDARDLIDSSSTKFVPPSIVRIGELSVEFMEAATAELAELREAVTAPAPAPVDAATPTA